VCEDEAGEANEEGEEVEEELEDGMLEDGCNRGVDSIG